MFKTVHLCLSMVLLHFVKCIWNMHININFLTSFPDNCLVIPQNQLLLTILARDQAYDKAECFCSLHIILVSSSAWSSTINYILVLAAAWGSIMPSLCCSMMVKTMPVLCILMLPRLTSCLEDQSCDAMLDQEQPERLCSMALLHCRKIISQSEKASCFSHYGYMYLVDLGSSRSNLRIWPSWIHVWQNKCLNFFLCSTIFIHCQHPERGVALKSPFILSMPMKQTFWIFFCSLTRGASHLWHRGYLLL